MDLTFRKTATAGRYELFEGKLHLGTVQRTRKGWDGIDINGVLVVEDYRGSRAVAASNTARASHDALAQKTNEVLDRVETENVSILPMVPGCTFGQWLRQANAVVQQAEALREMKVPHGQRHAAVRLLVENAKTLAAWTADDRN